MSTVTALATLPPPPMALPHELEVPDDLLLPGIVHSVFAAGVISLIILANQEQSEGSGWTSIPREKISELASQHCVLVTSGELGGEMFADNPEVGVQFGLEALTELGLIERHGYSIALTRPLIDSLKALLRR